MKRPAVVAAITGLLSAVAGGLLGRFLGYWFGVLVMLVFWAGPAHSGKAPPDKDVQQFLRTATAAGTVLGALLAALIGVLVALLVARVRRSRRPRPAGWEEF
jgi:hypothetical protein